jgi:hypothetical protein
MMYGAAALACYSFVLCQLLVRCHLSAVYASILALAVWLAVAFYPLVIGLEVGK